MDERIGIVGFGRFGAALAELATSVGAAVRGWDGRREAPSPFASASPQALAAHSSLLVLAVPVPAVREAAQVLRPHLRPDQLVLHVCSVQDGPNRALEEELGKSVPWVGTHPLFGPSSIALGERPLRAVVCRNPMHPEAAPRARQLYERLGLDVLEQDPRDHDRAMAYSHALAFFVAKGMIDLGEIDRLPFAPPSFQAMARTIDSVRSDASHLFLAIERSNPFAAEARQRLLESLTQVHEQLDRVEESSADSESLFPIPDLGRRAPELRAARELIDEIDLGLLDLLARRAVLARRAGRIKAEQGHGVRDPERERELLTERRCAAEARGLDPDAIERIFAAVLRFSREVQKRGD